MGLLVERCCSYCNANGNVLECKAERSCRSNLIFVFVFTSNREDDNNSGSKFGSPFQVIMVRSTSMLYCIKVCLCENRQKYDIGKDCTYIFHMMFLPLHKAGRSGRCQLRC